MKTDAPLAVQLQQTSGLSFLTVEQALQKVLRERLSRSAACPHLIEPEIISVGQEKDPIFHLLASHFGASETTLESLRDDVLVVEEIETCREIRLGRLAGEPWRYLEGFPQTHACPHQETGSSRIVRAALELLLHEAPAMYAFVSQHVRLVVITTVDTNVPRLSFSLRDSAFGLIFLQSTVKTVFEAALLIVHEAIHQCIWLSWASNDLKPFSKKCDVVISPFSNRLISHQVAFQSIIIHLESADLFDLLRRVRPDEDHAFEDCMHQHLADPGVHLGLISKLRDQIAEAEDYSGYEHRALQFVNNQMELKYDAL